MVLHKKSRIRREMTNRYTTTANYLFTTRFSRLTVNPLSLAKFSNESSYRIPQFSPLVCFFLHHLIGPSRAFNRMAGGASSYQHIDFLPDSLTFLLQSLKWQNGDSSLLASAHFKWKYRKTVLHP